MSAKSKLKDIADAFYAAAVNSHASGMELLARSARIETLSRVCTEEQAERCLAELERDGLPAKGYVS